MGNNTFIQFGKKLKILGDDFSYRFPRLKKVIKPIYHKIFLDKFYEIKHNAFLAQAYNVIDLFDRTLTTAQIQYSLGFGTMLGAVREKGIIGHDADMDTLVWAEGNSSEKVKNALESAGFKRTRCFLINNGELGREETYEFNNVPIDIFYIYQPVDTLPYTAYYLPIEGYTTYKMSMKKTGEVRAIRLDRPYEKDYVRVPFGPLSLPIMQHYDPILKACYGENYMIPDPSFQRLAPQKWNNVHAIML